MHDFEIIKLPQRRKLLFLDTKFFELFDRAFKQFPYSDSLN